MYFKPEQIAQMNIFKMHLIKSKFYQDSLGSCKQKLHYLGFEVPGDISRN